VGHKAAPGHGTRLHESAAWRPAADRCFKDFAKRPTYAFDHSSGIRGSCPNG